jgi:hypothetical protein
MKMQMIFRKPAASGPAGRTRRRRGTFALEPVEALPRLAQRVRELAERSVDPNPFFLPEFLEPAIRAFGRKGLRLATYSDREDLRFFAPVLTSGGPVLGGRRFSVWAHSYAPLGSPLIDRDMSREVGDALIRHMRRSGRTLFTAPHLPLTGATAEVLREAAKRHGFSIDAERQMRPVLYPALADGTAEFDRMVSQRRRRELDRQLRRLCEAGAVSFMSARTASEIEAAFNAFVTLESSGWKGRSGTAMARRHQVREFARIAVMQLAQVGHAAIDIMRVGDKAVAALIRLDQGNLSIPWKIAFDEEYAAFSPGKQLMCDETRRWFSYATVARVDPVCEQDNALMAPLWRDREPYGTLFVSSSRLGIRTRLRAGVANLRMLVKAQAKTLLRSSKGTARPQPKTKRSPARKTRRGATTTSSSSAALPRRSPRAQSSR